jgi:WS/DGAT/MGAT family acyltransferase
MGTQLTMLDTMFLELEQAQDTSHMHIGVALVFDPPPDGEPSLDALAGRFEERIGAMPQFAQRLSHPHTDPMRWLTWEPMPDFDVREHLRRATLPAPGGNAELEEWLGDFWSHRLDRHRPLWEVTLIDGLADGRWVLATKAHHCLVDGVGTIDVGALMLDDVDDALLHKHDDEEHGEHGNGGRSWLSPGLLLRNARSGISAALHPRTTIEKAVAAAELVIRQELNPAPHTSFNRELTGARHYRTARISLKDINRIREQHGGTINDVVLAACSGALRSLLLSRGEEPPPGLRAQVPVNVRTENEHGEVGNRITSLFVELPVEESDRIARLTRIRERAAELKSGSQATGGAAIAKLTDVGPPLFGILVARSMFGNDRIFNLTITNVPGPQEKLTALGATLVEALPFVPLFAQHTIGIAIASYNGNLVVGISADRHNAPDIDVLADGMERAFEELRAGATV